MARANRPPHPLRTPKTIEKILEKVSNGISLRAICREDGIPPLTTVLRWLAEDAKLSEQYARARERQAEFYASEIIEIADRAEDPQIARLQIDARKWVASKLLPKVYGDKQEIEHTGKDGTPLVPVINFGKKPTQ